MNASANPAGFRLLDDVPWKWVRRSMDRGWRIHAAVWHVCDQWTPDRGRAESRRRWPNPRALERRGRLRASF